MKKQLYYSAVRYKRKIQVSQQFRLTYLCFLIVGFSDLLLKDSEGKEPHRIRMKNFKQNVRLSEFLS